MSHPATTVPEDRSAPVDGANAGRSRRDWTSAVARGARQKCPACGVGHLYGRYLKVEPVCSNCGETLSHHRADDAPPYFTIVIVGHIIIGLVLAVEKAFHPEIWVHYALWLPLTVILSLYLLPRIKGALIGLQWALYMHGFGNTCSEEGDVAKRSS